MITVPLAPDRRRPASRRPPRRMRRDDFSRRLVRETVLTPDYPPEV